MNLALLGTGQLGRAAHGAAIARGHQVSARFNREAPLPDTPERPACLRTADVLLEATLPEAVLPHVERCCRWGLPMVVATTGWYDHLPQVARLVDRYDATVLYAPNFSLGMALLRQALRHVVPLLNRLDAFDVSVHEVHHTRKADSPSGTARMLADLLVSGLDRKTHLATETPHGGADPEALHVTAARVGTVFGEHTVTLVSPSDRLTLTHEARDRGGFAEGLVRAAEWLAGRRGLFTLDDVLADWLAVTPAYA